MVQGRTSKQPKLHPCRPTSSHTRPRPPMEVGAERIPEIMNRHIKRFKNLIIDRPLEEIADTLEQDGPKQALKKSVPFLLAIVGTVGLLAVVLLALLYTVRKAIWNVIVLVVMGGVLWASYLENKSTTGPTATKEPTMEQYVTVGNIVKMAAKRVAPMLELGPIYEETDIKAVQEERIVPKGKIFLFKYRLPKKCVSTTIDELQFNRAFQHEIETVVYNYNPAGYDKVRFVNGGVDECVLQIDHVSQGDLYVYIYCCYTSADYFIQREQEREQLGHENTADKGDIDF